MRDQRIAATSHPGTVECLACGHKWEHLPNTNHTAIGEGICTVKRATGKPHLRLHYVTSPLLNDLRNPYPWYVVFVRGPFPIAGSAATYHHSTAAKAVRAAGVVWWGLPTGRYAQMQAPPPPPAPGTPEWAQWQIVNTFTDDADRKAITDTVAAGLVPYPSLSKARMHYALACHARQWQGWQARLAWACVEALLRDPIADDDSIPF